MATKLELWFSVDLEADGPIPGDYSMQSIGIVPVDRDIEAEFYTELKPISDKFEPGAAKVSGLDREQLKREGSDPQTAMKHLDAWVRGVCGPRNAKPVFASFGTFDWMFSHWYLIHFLGKDPFGVNSLDIKSYAMGALGLERWEQSRKSWLPNRFRSNLPHTHNALDDAKEQAEVLRKFRGEAMTLHNGVYVPVM